MEKKQSLMFGLIALLGMILISGCTQSSSGIVAWERACVVDEDCTYVQNSPGEGRPSCLNLSHLQDTSGLIIDENIPCVCSPIGTQAGEGVWVEGVGGLRVEDAGVEVCKIKTNAP